MELVLGLTDTNKVTGSEGEERAAVLPSRIARITGRVLRSSRRGATRTASVGLADTARHTLSRRRKHGREIPLRSRDLVLRLRLGEGMRADVVGLWGAASHGGLRMTVSLGGCARMWWGGAARHGPARDDMGGCPVIPSGPPRTPAAPSPSQAYRSQASNAAARNPAPVGEPADREEAPHMLGALQGCGPMWWGDGARRRTAGY